MSRLLWPALALALAAAVTPAAATVPERGLAAEGREAWDEALRIYAELLQGDPSATAVWIRVADIEARLGHAEAAADALAEAASITQDDAELEILLSRAGAAAGQPQRALAAAERALALAPDHLDYLAARGQLATWVGDYPLARASWERVVELDPGSLAAELGLARVEAWSGELDHAARRLRAYLDRAPEDAAARLELARVEAWRGDFAHALELLEDYRRLAGVDASYRRERAHSLLGAERPAAALEALGPVPAAPDDFWHQLTRTLALAERHPRQALEGLEVLAATHPDEPMTAEAFRVVRTPLRSALVPGFELYDDSDGVRIATGRLTAGVSPGASSRLQAGVFSGELEARLGSGLESIRGERVIDFEGIWAGLRHRLGAQAEVELRLGGVEADPLDDLATYAVTGHLRPTDRLRLELARERDYYLVSPRALSIGLERTTHRARLSWQSSLRSHLDLVVAHDDLSDGNTRRELSIEPRRSFARRQRWNLDLGLRGRWMGFDRDLDNGYYDPHDYLQLAATGFAYRKLSSDSGLSLVLSLGGYDDSQSGGFRFGGDATLALTLGLFRDWMLEVRAGASENARLASGAFSALGGGIFLTRRFGGPAPDPPGRGTPGSPRREEEPASDGWLSGHLPRRHAEAAAGVETRTGVTPEEEADRAPRHGAVDDAAAPPGLTIPSLDAEAPPAPAPETATIPPAVTPDDPAETITAEATHGEIVYEVQLGLFHHRQNALQLIAQLTDLGLSPYVVEVLSSQAEVRYTVRVGPLPSREAAIRRASELRDVNGLDTVIRYRRAAG